MGGVSDGEKSLVAAICVTSSATSRRIVHYAVRKVHSLDGKTVLGDAFLQSGE